MNTDLDKFYIPSYLDKPDKLFYCTMLEWMIFLLCIMFGLFAKSFGIGLIIGISFMTLSKKTKSRIDGQDLLLILYWHMPVWLSGFNALPLSHKRHYLI